MKQTVDRRVEHNRLVHDQVAATYDLAHTEIYNATEQARIASALQYAVSHIATSAAVPLVLDYGAGTGNLTRHLIDLGAQVVAGDVSPKSLEYVKQAFCSTGRLEVAELNGIDLSGFNNDSFDMVATYSVLHHVSDYLAIVHEFVRVVKPGGVIFIDHECAPSYWDEHSEEYLAYKSALENAHRKPIKAKLMRKLKNVFSIRAWRRLTMRTFWGLNDEGDIHVTADDHIEWDKIDDICVRSGEVLRREDYLVCRESGSAPALHRMFSGKCNDMRLMIYRRT